jgi:hypothetical protein
VVAWAFTDPEQGAQPRHVQPRPGSIDDGVKARFTAPEAKIRLRLYST